MIELYTFGTGNGWRASIALEECGLPYRGHKIDITKGEQRGEAFRAINPFGHIPAIVDPDGPGGRPIHINESAAILLYCAEKAGKFIPADPVEKIAAMRWVYHSISDAGAPIAGLFRLARLQEPDEALAFMRASLTAILKDADAVLGDAEYLVGDAVSIADLSFYTVAAQGGELIGGLGEMPNLARWAAMMRARPGVQRGMAVPG